MKRLWVYYKRKWHAWPYRGHRSECGTLNKQDLVTTPAKQIEPEPPPGAVLCESCRRATGTQRREARGVTAEESNWVGVIRRHLTHARVRLAEKHEWELARRLAALGAPTHPDAKRAFEHLKTLLLTPRVHRKANGRTTTKLVGVQEALSLFPPTDPTNLLRTIHALEVWGRQHPTLTINKFLPAQAVSTILALTEAEVPAYVAHLAERGLCAFTAVFHPNTLNRYRTEPTARGARTGSPAYWEATKHQLESQVLHD